MNALQEHIAVIAMQIVVIPTMDIHAHASRAIQETDFYVQVCC